MAFSFVTAGSANADNIAFGSHQAGDLILLAVYRNASTAAPVIPNDWLCAGLSTGNSNWLGLFFIEANSASMVSGSWTNTDHIAYAIYRPSSSTRRLTISRIVTAAGATTTISYSSMAQVGTPLDGWFGAVVGYRSNDTDLETPPTGMVNRTAIAGASAGELVLHDTGATDLAWPTTSVVVTGTTNTWRGIVFQIAEYAAAAAGGGDSEHSFISIG